MYTYSQCPVCKSKDFSEVFKAKDYTVSQEQFSIHHCKDCSHRFTNPIPTESEISPYYKSEAYVSHTNTSKGMINRLYQIVRRFTLRGKKKLVISASGKQTGVMLDIGSGAGAFLAEMKNAKWKAEGLEPDEDARKVAKTDFQVDARPISDFYELEEGKYDVVTMWHVLEHVHELDTYMEKILKLLKPGGTFLIAVPNYDSWDADRYQEEWAAYDVPRHLYHFRPESMKTLLKRTGFRLKRMKWMPYDSFYVSMLSERNRNGNIVRGIWNGFCSFLVALFRTERCSSVIYVAKK
ncbi:MAG TPA: class I SAM-dependent methyltransferase [Bacteroidetes bacterium]|nr:class I SAM-dependent methyltransferase [Bacteroidota bacterium]